VTSRNMATYLRLIGRTGWGRYQLEDYLRDENSTQAVVDAYAPDVEIIEPPSLPHGGVHRGRDAWRVMRQRIEELWDQRFELLDLWEIPEDDVIVLSASMEWTAKATGRSACSPFVSVITFRDGLISRVEIFHHDTKAILDTLEPAATTSGRKE